MAVEADWAGRPYGVNRYVRAQGKARDADDALAGLKRFPAWMWRKTEVPDFVGWLRAITTRFRRPS